MFKLSCSRPCPIQGAIYVDRRMSVRLGPMTDAQGDRWDVRGIFGGGKHGEWIVQAVRLESLHPHYTDTSTASYGFVTQTWKPYRLVEMSQIAL